MILFDLGYLAAAPIALPLLALKSLRTGKYRSGLAERFGRGPELLPKRSPEIRVLLLHCVSVGELNSVTTLIRRLLSADPHLHIALSTTTDTGTDRAQTLYPPGPAARIHPVRFPFDFSFAVEHFLDRIRPDAVALVELETWPNFLAIAQSRRIPVTLINGRISERSFPRYRLIRPLMKSMLQKLTWIAAQTRTIADRFRALGAPMERLEALPTLKYDNADISPNVPGKNALAAAIGLSSDHKLFVAGSTGPGEERAILDTYLALKEKYPILRLAIAPRHPEVVQQVIAAIRVRHLTPILRTDRPDPSHLEFGVLHSEFPSSAVFLLNTMGELRKLYALAFAVFAGRSLVKLGGSDMIEVAALAKPCCFGPYTANFAETVELLLQNQAAAMVHNPIDLTTRLTQWLTQPEAAEAMGKKAQMLLQAQKGSTERYVRKLISLCRPAY